MYWPSVPRVLKSRRLIEESSLPTTMELTLSGINLIAVIPQSFLSYTLMQQNLGILSLLGVLIFVGSFALSMGPVVWVILSEMFPNKVRSVAMSVAVAVQWGANYIVSQSFPVVTESTMNQNEFWNGSLPYFIFIGFIMIIALFTYKFIPETKGKSLEEMEKLWDI